MKKHLRLISAILCFAVVAGVLFVGEIEAKATWLPAKIEQQYDLGTIFTVPQREMNVDGQQAEVTAVVRLPDGTVTSRQEFALNDAGKYTVVYTAVANGKVYVDEVSFLVMQEFCVLTSEDSTAVYGKAPSVQGVSGLHVSLKYGDKLKLNAPISIDALEDGMLIQGFVIPEKVGTLDYEKLCFQFTDAENPEITLYMSVRQYSNSPEIRASYVTAGGNGQEIIGFDDYADKFWTEGLWGRNIYHGFAYECTDVLNTGINLSLDTATMQILANGNMVVDLDSVEYQKSPWGGFPSGKAYLTVWAENYKGLTANFFLSTVGDLDLSQRIIKDTEPPEFQIQTPYETPPAAVKGGIYSVPAATAKDNTGTVSDVRVSAWYNYSSPDASILNIEDGCFETNYVGDYAIVYEATDAYGNLGREILWIKSLEQVEKPTIAFVGEAKTQYVLGEYFVPAEYTTTCHSGQPTVQIFTTVNGEQTVLTENYCFETAGQYQLTYQITDCAGQSQTLEQTIQVDIGDKPIMVDRIELPEYLIEDSQYAFPSVYFHDYRSGTVEKKLATGKIQDAAGTAAIEAGKPFAVRVENNMDLVTIVFECEGAVYQVERPVIKAFDSDEGKTRLFLENYFVGQGFTCTREEKGMLFTVDAPDAHWTFANPLLATDFSMVLEGVAGKADFDGMVLTFRDSADTSKCLAVELLQKNGVLGVQVGNTVLYMGEVSLNAGHQVRITYAEGKLQIAGFDIDIGEFTDFDSHYLTLSMAFREADAGAQLRLVSLNNHTLNNSNRDRVEAWIDVTGSYGGRFEAGTQIVLPAAYAADVLNPNITFHLTVKQGDTVVTADDGTVLENVDPNREYTITATAEGRYDVIYTTEESFSEKEGGLSYVLHIVDGSAPVIQFKGDLPTKAKTGDALCIPEFTVSDSKTPAEELIVLKTVTGPSGVIVTIPADSNSVWATQAGTYKFTVMVVDSDGYICNKTWSVTVTDDGK